VVASTEPASIENIIAHIQLLQIVQAFLLITSGLILAWLASLTVNKLVVKRFPNSNVILFRKITIYFIIIMFFVAALQQLGFSLSIFLGAAGILTLAIAFAAQLTVSNFISGLFLIAEKPFRVGEWISLDSISGEVICTDALSIRIRTSENTMVRIPNETLIKANITNLSRFPIRRFDLTVGVAYKADSEKIKALLLMTAAQNNFCLKEPAPKVNLASFGESAVNWQLLVYANREDFLDLKNTLQQEVKIIFEKNNIEMPYPTRSFYTSSDTSPLAIKIISSDKTDL
jgi:small-conductance mechanosensitive channel